MSFQAMEVIGHYLYDKQDIIGHGAFAMVYKGCKKQDRRFQVAVKCIQKKELNKSKELLAKEIKVLRELSVCQHENLVALLDVKESDSSVYLVLEYCNGGDLAGYLQSKGTLSEDALSSFMQQIASALKALYEKGIMHRDIKPQNILLSLPKGGSKATTPPTHITFKLGDFGFARFLQDGMMAGTLCGSPMYMAPEVIMSQKYDAKADLWSVGFIVFQCLAGKGPFYATTPPELRDFYHRHVDLKPKIPDNASPELGNVLLRLLTRDPTKRIGIKELMEHPFLKKFRRSPSKRGHSSSPIPARQHTPSLSSESSSPGSNREVSPLARQVGEAGEMVSTLTGSNEEDSGFMKVEKPDTRPHTPDDFVLVPEGLPEFNSSGERRVKADRAPLALAEEEYDAVDGSLTSSVQPVRLQTSEGKAVFHREEPLHHPSPNTSRLSSPQSPSPSPPLCQRWGGSSAPIPVPSLSRMGGVAPREGSGSKSGSPAHGKKRSASICSGDRPGDRVTGRRNSETALAAPDITQVSPPAVQFTMGTPPNTGTWKRSSPFSTGGSAVRLEGGTSAPVLAGSPLRRSASCSPGSCFTPHHPYPTPASPAPLPAISGSSARHCPYHHHPQHYHHLHHHHHHQPVHDPYAFHDPKFHRYPTVPDCTALLACPAVEECGLEPCHRCGTEPDLRSQPFGASPVLRAGGYSAPQQPATVPCLGALVPWSGSGEHLTSLVGDKDRGSLCSLEQDRTTPLTQRRSSLRGDNSSPSSRLFAAAPLRLDAPPFVPSELSEDTLMDAHNRSCNSRLAIQGVRQGKQAEHNQTMARLRFILDVVDSVVTLARSKGAACHPMVDSVCVGPKADCTASFSLSTKLPEWQRLVEQLVLYLRALQMIAQSISLAQREMKQDRLQYVASLREVLHQQNKQYVQCIEECRRLHEQLGSMCKTPLTPQLIVNTADKLIYNYAVEECQSAALDELGGNKNECWNRYSTAQILLHSLAQMARNDQDRQLLEKYRRFVELRLHYLRGMQRACPVWS